MCSRIFDSAVLFDITLAGGKSQTSVIPKTNPAPFEK